MARPNNDDPGQYGIHLGGDGIWRHRSGRPASITLHEVMARDGGMPGLTAAARQAHAAALMKWGAASGQEWTQPGAAHSIKEQPDEVVTYVMRGLVARQSREQLRTARANAAAASIQAAERNMRARVGIRDTSNWKKR